MRNQLIISVDRKFFVVLQYLLDCALHSNIIWGWATMRLIIEIEFPNFPPKIAALLFTAALSLSGVWLIFVGWIRDKVSFGVSRIGKD